MDANLNHAQKPVAIPSRNPDIVAIQLVLKDTSVVLHWGRKDFSMWRQVDSIGFGSKCETEECCAKPKPSDVECGRSGCHCCSDGERFLGNSGPTLTSEKACGQRYLEPSKPACPRDTKLCPDGSTYVSRDVRKNCEFRPCPLPSSVHSEVPSIVPLILPSAAPSAEPSIVHSILPSTPPSAEPSSAPSVQPSSDSSSCGYPGVAPSSEPSSNPTMPPSIFTSPVPTGEPRVQSRARFPPLVHPPLLLRNPV